MSTPSLLQVDMPLNQEIKAEAQARVQYSIWVLLGFYIFWIGVNQEFNESGVCNNGFVHLLYLSTDLFCASSFHFWE